MCTESRITALVFMLSFLLVGASCASADNTVELKGQRFKVELATSRQAQARGLMFVKEMPPDQGMLFIFPGEAPRSFWMKNTRIALDILYFDRNLSLVSVVHNARPCVVDPCPPYPSKGPAQYVLELNAGQAAALELVEGDRLVLHLAD